LAGLLATTLIFIPRELGDEYDPDPVFDLANRAGRLSYELGVLARDLRRGAADVAVRAHDVARRADDLDSAVGPQAAKVVELVREVVKRRA
jgi:hypothetical protein